MSAAIKRAGVPERARLRARAEDVIALSSAIEAEIVEVLHRPKFAGAMTSLRRDHVLDLIRDAAVRFEPTVRVTDCRDAKDNKYLELSLAASATVIVASDQDLLVLHPWRGVRIVRPGEYLAV